MTNDGLSDCAGYRVEMRDGRIGSVAAVLPRTGRDERGVLIVHSGLLSCRLSAVPFDEVESVDVERRRILLREEPATVRPERPSMSDTASSTRLSADSYSVERRNRDRACHRWHGPAPAGDWNRETKATRKEIVMFKTIIWATDGSEAADRALPTALDLTAEAKGRLLVVHADQRLVGRAGNVPAIANEEDVQSELASKVDEFVESGIDASFRVVHGTNKDPADLIAAVAREVDADLMVVGTRGHGRVAGMLLGSVTQRLLHVAPCPVLAVPAKVAAKVGVGTS